MNQLRNPFRIMRVIDRAFNMVGSFGSLGFYRGLALVTAEGKPVRREGPKWNAKRINQETFFLFGQFSVSWVMKFSPSGFQISSDSSLCTG